MNEAKNFMLKPFEKSKSKLNKPCAAFLQYSELSLIEMKRLREQQSKYSIDEDFMIDMETIVTNYEGESVFTLFKKDNKVYSFLEEQINREKQEFQGSDEINEDHIKIK